VGGHGQLITLLGLVALGSLACGLVLRGQACLAGRTRPWFLLGALCWAAEALSLLPCVLGGGSLWGVFYVVLNLVTAPGMLVAALGAAVTSGAPLWRWTLLGGLGLLAAGWMTLYQGNRPQAAADCAGHADWVRRGTCLAWAARHSGDSGLCLLIELESSRFACLHELAGHHWDPGLCDQISDENRPTGRGRRTSAGAFTIPQLRATCRKQF
jgi:hypothetical protein